MLFLSFPPTVAALSGFLDLYVMGRWGLVLCFVCVSKLSKALGAKPTRSPECPFPGVPANNKFPRWHMVRDNLFLHPAYNQGLHGTWHGQTATNPVHFYPGEEFLSWGRISNGSNVWLKKKIKGVPRELLFLILSLKKKPMKVANILHTLLLNLVFYLLFVEPFNFKILAFHNPENELFHVS